MMSILLRKFLKVFGEETKRGKYNELESLDKIVVNLFVFVFFLEIRTGQRVSFDEHDTHICCLSKKLTTHNDQLSCNFKTRSIKHKFNETILFEKCCNRKQINFV